MDRKDFFFKQRVTEGELDAAFDDAERALWNLAIDSQMFGIFRGATPTPGGARRVNLTGPIAAYDRLGRRIYKGETETVVDLDFDDNGVSTKILGGNTNVRWVSVFLIFDRHLDDPRVDGLAQEVYFLRDEHYTISIRQGSEAPGPHNLRPALDEEGVLVGDFLIEKGDFQDETSTWSYILDEAAIDLSRRQDFVVYDPTHIGTDLDASAGWDFLPHAEGTSLQDVLDAIDAWMTSHAAGGVARHRADAIDWTSGASTLMGNDQDLEAALLELDDKLTGNSAGTTGDSYIGAYAHTPADVPVTLASGTVRSQISALLAAHNAHLEDTTAAHNPTAINGLTVTTGAVSLSGANLATYLTALQNKMVGSYERNLTANAYVSLAPGAMSPAIINMAEEPKSLRIKVKRVGTIGRWLFSGVDPLDLDWKFEDVSVYVYDDSLVGTGPWRVVVANNHGTHTLGVNIDAFRAS